MMTANRFFTLALAVMLLGGCASKGSFTEGDVEARNARLNKQSEAKTVEVLSGPYVGAVPVRLAKTDVLLDSRITLNMRGSLEAICTQARQLVPLSFQVLDEDMPNPKAIGQAGQGLENLSLDTGFSGARRIVYDGPVKGFLDYAGNLFGLGWEYNATSGTVVFSRMQVKTFTLLGALGQVAYQSQITNKSKESNSSTSSASGVGQTVTTADMSSQTTLTNTSNLLFEIWNDVETNIKGLLSKGGKVTSNRAAGTITVRDTAPVLRHVEKLIADTNLKLSRQVALTVKVWQLELNDNVEAGFNLNALLKSGNLNLAAGSALSSEATGGQVSAAIIDGKWQDSSAMLKALSSVGHTRLVSTGTGVTMSNQPFPLQDIKKDTYLASASTNTTDYGQTSEITPGEVTSGFAMTFIPHILDKRQLILQYNIILSALDGIEHYQTETIRVDMPKTSTRSFSQRVTMKMGQTLVLAGFEQEKVGSSRDLGLFSAQKGDTYKRTLMVITISVESVPGYMEGDPKDTLVSGLTPEMARELFNAVRVSLSGQEAA